MKKTSLRIAIAAGLFNQEITSSLVKLCRLELVKQGVKPNRVQEFWVPGAYELPFAAKKLAKSHKFDAVICLGCVIKGDTTHDVYVSTWASVGTGQVALETGIPIIFGVLTPKNEKQAWQRARPGEFNRGKEMALAALDMIRFNRTKV